MIEYSKARPFLRTGDVLLVKNRGIISVAIRAVTAESFNHVAMIQRRGKGVWVAEMREGKGFQQMPLSQWLEKNKKAEVWWGRANEKLRSSDCVNQLIDDTRATGMKYSYWSLISVWLSQLFNVKTKHRSVCSTWVQAVARQCDGWHQDKSADPGDIAKHYSPLTFLMRK